jgi:hypothetical protein
VSAAIQDGGLAAATLDNRISPSFLTRSSGGSKDSPPNVCAIQVVDTVALSPCPRTRRSYLRIPLSNGEGTPPNQKGLVRVVVVVMGVVGVMIIAMVVGHRVADGRAAHASDHSPDWPAHNRSADRTSDSSGYRSRLVG